MVLAQVLVFQLLIHGVPKGMNVVLQTMIGSRMRGISLPV
jgi:hypothetical protein